MELAGARLRKAKDLAHFTKWPGFAVAQPDNRPVPLAQLIHRLAELVKGGALLQSFRGIAPLILVDGVPATAGAIASPLLEDMLQRNEARCRMLLYLLDRLHAGAKTERQLLLRRPTSELACKLLRRTFYLSRAASQ